MEYFSVFLFFYIYKTFAANQKILLETGLTPGQRCEGLAFLGEAPQTRGRCALVITNIMEPKVKEKKKNCGEQKALKCVEQYSSKLRGSPGALIGDEVCSVSRCSSFYSSSILPDSGGARAVNPPAVVPQHT